MSEDFINKLDVDNACSICLGPLDGKLLVITDLHCGHHFHTKCIEQWQRADKGTGAHRLCPNCRQPIAYDDMPAGNYRRRILN